MSLLCNRRSHLSYIQNNDPQDVYVTSGGIVFCVNNPCPNRHLFPYPQNAELPFNTVRILPPPALPVTRDRESIAHPGPPVSNPTPQPIQVSEPEAGTSSIPGAFETSQPSQTRSGNAPPPSPISRVPSEHSSILGDFFQSLIQKGTPATSPVNRPTDVPPSPSQPRGTFSARSNSSEEDEEEVDEGLGEPEEVENTVVYQSFDPNPVEIEPPEPILEVVDDPIDEPVLAPEESPNPIQVDEPGDLHSPPSQSANLPPNQPPAGGPPSFPSSSTGSPARTPSPPPNPPPGGPPGGPPPGPVTAPPMSAPPRVPLRGKAPFIFKGEAERVEAWLMACQVYYLLNPEIYKDDDVKILSAFTWTDIEIPSIRRWQDDLVTKGVRLTPPSFGTWEDFVQNFQKRFGLQLQELAAIQGLLTLRQGKYEPLSNFRDKFLQMHSQSGFSDKDAIWKINSMVLPHIINAFDAQGRTSGNDPVAYLEVLVEIDNTLRQREIEHCIQRGKPVPAHLQNHNDYWDDKPKGSGHSSHSRDPNAMDVDRFQTSRRPRDPSRPKITPQQYEHRKTNKLCFVCGERGCGTTNHYYSEYGGGKVVFHPQARKKPSGSSSSTRTRIIEIEIEDSDEEDVDDDVRYVEKETYSERSKSPSDWPQNAPQVPQQSVPIPDSSIYAPDTVLPLVREELDPVVINRLRASDPETFALWEDENIISSTKSF